MRRFLLIGVLAVAAGVGAYLLLFQEEDTYDLKFTLANATGLKEGAPVVNGGVDIGTAELDANRENVEITLKIKEEYAPLGKDTSAKIIAQNALGQKQVQVVPGDLSDPAPNGYTLPEEQVITTTDLDQLLATLDPDTRTRLAVVINEMGTAFAGRELDFKMFVNDLAPALQSAGTVLDQLGQDNAALTNLVDTSDRYVAELAAERERLSRMVALFGGTATTIAERRDELDLSLRNAAATTEPLMSFFVELEKLAPVVAGTARLLEQTAPSLEATLDRIQPFSTAARPALRTATAVAPDLERLANQGSPILQRSVPMLGSLAALSSNEVPPVGETLDNSADNLIAVLENWSRAIQFRDKLSHIFRGEATFAPDNLNFLIRRFAGLPIEPGFHEEVDPAEQAPGGGAQPGAAKTPGKNPSLPGAPNLPGLPKIPGLPNLLPQQGGNSGQQSSVPDLLDFLLG